MKKLAILVVASVLVSVVVTSAALAATLALAPGELVSFPYLDRFRIVRTEHLSRMRPHPYSDFVLSFAALVSVALLLALLLGARQHRRGQRALGLAGLAAALVLATGAAYGAERGMRWLEWLRRPGPGQYGLAVLPIYPTRGVFICFAAVGAVGLAGVLLVTDTLGRGRVRAGLACRCGYDLRESPDRCPECGRTFRR
jgi:hypothetical protein